MELIILRHGIAEDREEFAKKSQEDHLRPLTLKGRKRVQKMAMEMRDWMDTVDLIVTSPYTRARQTAELASQIFMETRVVECPELVPSSPPQAFKRWLKAHGDGYKRILAVGHEPHLSIFASFLLSGQVEPLLEIRKGGVLCIKVENFKNLAPGSGRLLWLVPPRFILD